VLAAGLAFAGCGGGSSDEESASGSIAANTTAETTSPPTTEAEPVATTTSTTTTSTTTTTVVDVAASRAAYCDASLDYWVPTGALDFYDAGDGGAVGQTFDDLNRLVQGPIDTAPDDAARQSPAEAQVILAELTPLLAAVDFDPTLLSESDRDQADALINGFYDSQDRLSSFLIDQCGFVGEDLIGLARDYAFSLATLPLAADANPLVGNDSVPETTSPTVEPTPITDASGSIQVDVPAEWSDVSGEPGPTEDRLVASTDRDSFLAGFSVPGMFIEAVDIPDGSGRDAYPIAVDSIITAYEANGCVQQTEELYSDPVYVGTEVVLSCVPGFEVRVISGTDDPGTRIFAIVMVLEEGDSTTRNLVANTFFV